MQSLSACKNMQTSFAKLPSSAVVPFICEDSGPVLKENTENSYYSADFQITNAFEAYYLVYCSQLVSQWL